MQSSSDIRLALAATLAVLVFGQAQAIAKDTDSKPKGVRDGRDMPPPPPPEEELDGPGGPPPGPPPPGGPHGRPRMGGRLPGLGGIGRGALDFSALNLSEDQKTRIKNLRSEVQGKAREAHSNLRARRAEMRDLFFSPDATDKQIREKHAEVRAAQDKAESMMVEDFIAIRQVLTPEQRKQLADNRPERFRGARSDKTIKAK